LNIKQKTELRRFLIAGFIAVGTDITAYFLMLQYTQHDIAKTISFLCGTLAAFFINKYWTFKKYTINFKEILRFMVLYSATLGANVATNKYMLSMTGLIFFAFLFATGVSTVLNFTGQKFWVFR
jgi:putative flippase GtrA